MGLNDRQRRFAEAYVLKPNAAEAARAAGYDPDFADRQGHRLLRNAEVQAFISAHQQVATKATQVNLQELLAEFLCIARADLAEAFDKTTGKPLPIHDIPVHLRRAIAGVEVEAGQIVKLKLWPKNSALDSLMRHLGAFKDKVEHELGPTFADLVEQSMKPKGAK